MSNTCQQFPVGSRQRAICEGTANLPLEKINVYRAKWGLEPLPDDGKERPRHVVHEGRPPGPRRSATAIPSSCGRCGGRTQLRGGPGTELMTIYRKAAVPSCQACRGLAKRMDEWGVSECRERLDEIVSDIFPRAKAWIAENRPWVHRLLPGIVEDAAIRMKIRNDVTAAIDAAESRRSTGIITAAGRNVETVSAAKDCGPRIWQTEERWQERVRDLLSRTEIIVKSFMRHEVLWKFANSVRQFYPDVSIRIADDSFKSPQETNPGAAAVQSLPGVHWHAMPFDSGLPAGRNLAVRESSAEFVIVCDDDFLFTRDTDLAAMVVPLVEQDLDLCGGIIRNDGRMAANWCGMLHINESPHRRELVMSPVDTPVECCHGVRLRRCHVTYNFFAARRDVLLAHPWDERYKITSEHLDSFAQWWHDGLNIAYTVDCICAHQAHKPFDRSYSQFRKRNQSHDLLSKWNVDGRRTIPITKFPGL